MTRISTDKRRSRLDAFQLFCGFSAIVSPFVPIRKKPGRDLKLKPILFGSLAVLVGVALASGQDAGLREIGILKLLDLSASPESVDYVVNKTEFQLHTLLTEQRHPKTWNLGERIQTDTEAGLRMLFSADEDIQARTDALAKDPAALETLAAEMERAILEKRRIYFYGCGATGRLAKQMESSFWRPFWATIKADPDLWAKLQDKVGADVEERLIGEMTGADRALISSLEGFEDLQIIGRLQLADRGIRKGDVVVAVTEGGETSSVIGTVIAALDQWKAAPGYQAAESRKRLYFVYNNPDDRLRPFARSRAVIDEAGITKINLTTGPQAVTGSTRMQATTSETFVLGAVLESAVEHVLRSVLSKKEMAQAGFPAETPLPARLAAFGSILREVKRRVPDLARLTDLESRTYDSGRFSTYFARSGLITVFIDSTERSPTFRLYPLDTVKEPRRKCWIQVWADAPDIPSAWRTFLGRPFRGLASSFYRGPFETEIEDPYLRDKALTSLTRAGNDQQKLYDFSFSDAAVKKRGPKKGDLGVMALLGPEAEEARKTGSAFNRFEGIFRAAGAGLGTIAVTDAPASGPAAAEPGTVHVRLAVSSADDPFRLGQHIALKMVLNAHSTAVMAKLGKVVGNTMTNVSPSNLKLIGRATFLIQSHVNDTLGRPAWVRQYGTRRPVSYGEANAVLFDSIAFMKEKAADAGQAAEVPLSIIRILESVRRNRNFTAEEALELVRKPGLAAYLAEF
jgi:N-acetylmuramic acid 6-phosphate etherase